MLIAGDSYLEPMYRAINLVSINPYDFIPISMDKARNQELGFRIYGIYGGVFSVCL